MEKEKAKTQVMLVLNLSCVTYPPQSFAGTLNGKQIRLLGGLDAFQHQLQNLAEKLILQRGIGVTCGPRRTLRSVENDDWSSYRQIDEPHVHRVHWPRSRMKQQ